MVVSIGEEPEGGGVYFCTEKDKGNYYLVVKTEDLKRIMSLIK